MKLALFSIALGLSLPVFAADQVAVNKPQQVYQNSLLKAEAHDDIKALIMNHEHVRNPDFVQIFEQFTDCSPMESEKPSLICMGFYSVYYQAPAAGVEPSFGEFTISFGLMGQEIGWVIDEKISIMQDL